MNELRAFSDNSQHRNLAKNLRMLLDAHGVSESKIAQELNIPVMTVRRIVSGETSDPRISTLKLIADYFKVTVDSLTEDNNQKSIFSMTQKRPQFIPILNWKLISETKSIKEIDFKLVKEWHPITLSNQYSLSNHAFALESRPSMQPRFPVGTLFVIEPKEIPTDGDIALIKIKKTGDLSLREIIIDPPKWQLQPIVSGSESFFYHEKEHTIVGIVMLTMLYARKDRITN